MGYNAEQVKKAIKLAADRLEDRKQELNKLDAAIGDGDHGRSISRAFGGMAEELEELDSEDVGDLLKEIGKQIVFSSGAAAGPLFGTGVMEAGKAVSGKKEINLGDLARMFAAAEEGVKERGGGKVGEKTMLDTLDPTRKALEEAANEEISMEDAADRAIQAAKEGRDSTEEMVSERGRSSRLGERTKGHIDPGAASSFIIIESLFNSCSEE